MTNTTPIPTTPSTDPPTSETPSGPLGADSPEGGLTGVLRDLTGFLTMQDGATHDVALRSLMRIGHTGDAREFRKIVEAETIRGVSILQLSKILKLTTYIDRLQEDLFSEDVFTNPRILYRDKVRLLTTAAQDLRTRLDMVLHAETKSSPSMPDPNAHPEDRIEDSDLSPQSRLRIRELIRKLSIEVERKSVSVMDITPTPPAPRKPKKLPRAPK